MGRLYSTHDEDRAIDRIPKGKRKLRKCGLTWKDSVEKGLKETAYKSMEWINRLRIGPIDGFLWAQ